MALIACEKKNKRTNNSIQVLARFILWSFHNNSNVSLLCVCVCVCVCVWPVPFCLFLSFVSLFLYEKKNRTKCKRNGMETNKNEKTHFDRIGFQYKKKVTKSIRIRLARNGMRRDLNWIYFKWLRRTENPIHSFRIDENRRNWEPERKPLELFHGRVLWTSTVDTKVGSSKKTAELGRRDVEMKEKPTRI